MGIAVFLVAVGILLIQKPKIAVARIEKCWWNLAWFWDRNQFRQFVSGSRSNQKINTQDLAITAGIMAAGIGCGLSLRHVVAQLAELDGELQDFFTAVSIQTRLGLAESEVWNSYADDQGIGELARDISLAVDSGIALREILVRYSEYTRENLLATVNERARQVSVKTVLPLMVCYLPAFMLTGIVPIIGGIVSKIL